MSLGWDGSCMVIGCEYDKTTDVHRFVHGLDGGEYTPENSFAVCPNHHAEEHRGITSFEIVGPMELREIGGGRGSRTPVRVTAASE